VRKNPFYKYLGPEDHLQMQCMKYCSMQYPNVLVVHVPNEGRRTPFERYRAKILGITAGIPDILVFRASGRYYGLAVEVKAGKNTATPAQRHILSRLKQEGWQTSVCRSLAEFKNTLDSYIHHGKSPAKDTANS